MNMYIIYFSLPNKETTDGSKTTIAQFSPTIWSSGNVVQNLCDINKVGLLFCSQVFAQNKTFMHVSLIPSLNR